MATRNYTRNEYPFHRPVNRRGAWDDQAQAFKRVVTKPRKTKPSRDWTGAVLLGLAAVDVALWLHVAQALSTLIA